MQLGCTFMFGEGLSGAYYMVWVFDQSRRHGFNSWSMRTWGVWRFWDFRVSGLRDLGQGCFIISMYERRPWKASDLGSSALL